MMCMGVSSVTAEDSDSVRSRVLLPVSTCGTCGEEGERGQQVGDDRGRRRAGKIRDGEQRGDGEQIGVREATREEGEAHGKGEGGMRQWVTTGEHWGREREEGRRHMKTWVNGGGGKGGKTTGVKHGFECERKSYTNQSALVSRRDQGLSHHERCNCNSKQLHTLEHSSKYHTWPVVSQSVQLAG